MSLHSWNDPHMVRTRKSLVKALYITLAVFLFLFVAFHIAGALYVSSITAKATNGFNAGIAQDLAFLKEQGDAVAKNELVQKYLIANDSTKLIEVLQQEKKARSIGLMGVANSEGIVVGRTKTPGKLGDNAFLISPVGRVVSTGKSVQSVEAPTGFDPHQIFLNTGRPILRDGQMIGGLFANYLTDDAYAMRFRDAYLSHGAEVVFYNKQAGLYGDSFSDPVTRKLLNSYFSPGSEWIQNGSLGKTISFKDGTFYLVQNIVFPGLEQSPGGALIFIPRTDISTLGNILIALITLFIFILFALQYHIRNQREEHGWRYYALFVGLFVPVLAVAFFALYFQNLGFLRLERVPYTLYNSTVRLQPEFGIYDMEFPQRFSIVVDTGDEDINAVQIGLLFDPSAVTITALETASSTCSYVLENTINAKEGTAKISCVVLKSDGERGSLPIADVIAIPRHPGTFTLSFDKKETQVLASDGLGTNVLRAVQSGSYRADTFDSYLFAGTAGTAGRSFVAFSPTHPNQSRWYNNDTVRFVWRGRPGAVYRYAFDSSPNTLPSNLHTTTQPSLTIPVPGDGIFYFHLQLVSGGPSAHYRVQVDRTPPAITGMHLSSEKVVVGDVVRFSFDAEDAGSGIEQNYYVDLGSHLFLPVGSQLFIPFLTAGDQKVVLRVYDGAGNYSQQSKLVHVDTP